MTFDIFHALLPSSIVMSRPRPPKLIWQLIFPVAVAASLGRQRRLSCSTAALSIRKQRKLRNIPSTAASAAASALNPLQTFRTRFRVVRHLKDKGGQSAALLSSGGAGGAPSFKQHMCMRGRSETASAHILATGPATKAWASGRTMSKRGTP